MEREWNENSDRISVERLNHLFDSDNLTAREYSFLLHKLYPVEKRISYFAWASSLCAGLNWILMLKFTIGDDVYQLLTGEGRQTAGTILAPLAVIFFFLAARERRGQENVKGFEVAVAGLAIAVAILTIIVPVHLIKLFHI